MIKKKNKKGESSASPVSPDGVLWKQFIQTVSAHIDPVLASMLYATDLINFDKQRQVVEVVTLKKFMLFQDLFLEQKHIYQEYLNRLFGYQVVLVVQFTKVEAAKPMPAPMAATVHDQPVVHHEVKRHENAPVKKMPFVPQNNMRRGQPQSSSMQFAKNERALDVSDTKKWKITHTLLDHLGGTVREIIKETDEFNA